MSIKASDLKRIVKNFLDFLDKNDVIVMAEEYEKKFPIAEALDEYISVELRPSSSELIARTKSPTVSYRAGGGIPLELRINKYEGYSRIILKTTLGILPGYRPFAVDIYNNIAQDKKLQTTEISEIKKELEKLLNVP